MRWSDRHIVLQKSADLRFYSDSDSVTFCHLLGIYKAVLGFDKIPNFAASFATQTLAHSRSRC